MSDVDTAILSAPSNTATPPCLGDADSFEYGEVAVPDEENLEDDISEDFDLAMQKLLESNMAASQPVEPDPIIERHPEVVDDYIRNFLIKMGMPKTLDSFETEWYDLKSAGKLAAAATDRVPDAHRHNAQLSDEIIMLRRRLEKANSIAEKASSTWDTFRKERDFHRMHHKRVLQEKNRLIKDIKQLKAHYEKYEPTIAALKRKYEAATREKSLTNIDRDRLAQALKALQAQVADASDNADTIKAAPAPAAVASPTKPQRGTPSLPGQPAGSAPDTTAEAAVGAAAAASVPAATPTRKAQSRSILGLLPAGPRRNPFANLQFEPLQCSGMQVAKAFKAHAMGIAHIVLHPRKPIAATASDDCMWRMWQLPESELVMAGEGHKDWVAGLDFHPGGACLASGSGDTTVKLWDFAEQRCAATLSEHTAAVWAVAFHDAGEVLASCSLDQTIRLWDVTTASLKSALRGHVDSVNEVQWLMSTNTIASASSDKTLSLWDARSGLPTATLYGHSNSVASVAPSLDGRRVVSADADGVLKAWDVRMLAESASVTVSSMPLNRVRLDRSAGVAVVAGDDGQVYAVDVEGGDVQGELSGHEESVQSVALDPEGAYVISAGADCSFILWN